MSNFPDFEGLGIGSQYATAFQRLLDAIKRIEAKVDALTTSIDRIDENKRPTCGNLYNLGTEAKP